VKEGTTRKAFEQKLTDVSAPEATSAARTGTPASDDLTLDQLFEVYTGLAEDAEGDADIEAKAERYLERVNEALRLLEIDTVEARTGGHADSQAAKKLAAYGRALKALGGT